MSVATNVTAFMCTDGSCDGLLVLAVLLGILIVCGWVLLFAIPIWLWGHWTLHPELVKTIDADSQQHSGPQRWLPSTRMDSPIQGLGVWLDEIRARGGAG